MCATVERYTLDVLSLESSGLNSGFQGLKFVWLLEGYGPSEGDGNERDRFWNYLDRIVDSTGNGYILCILGDMNGWIRGKVRAGINGVFGVPGDNDNGKRVVEFCVSCPLGSSMYI